MQIVLVASAQSPKPIRLPQTGALGDAIAADFGSFDAFKEKFAAAAVGVQGSGWAWLVFDKSTGRLAITTRANQVSLLFFVIL